MHGLVLLVAVLVGVASGVLFQAGTAHAEELEVFPLQVGNEWTYMLRNEWTYVLREGVPERTVRVTDTTSIADTTYFVTAGWHRLGFEGCDTIFVRKEWELSPLFDDGRKRERVFRRDNDRDQLWYDFAVTDWAYDVWRKPAKPASSVFLWRYQWYGPQGAQDLPFGTFRNVIQFTIDPSPSSRTRCSHCDEDHYFAPNLGLVKITLPAGEGLYAWVMTKGVVNGSIYDSGETVVSPETWGRIKKTHSAP